MEITKSSASHTISSWNSQARCLKVTSGFLHGTSNLTTSIYGALKRDRAAKRIPLGTFGL